MCAAQSILRRGGIRQLPGICWYPDKRTGHAVNQGGTADKYLFVLDRSLFSVRGEFFCSPGREPGEYFYLEVQTMQILPTLDQVREIASAGTYRVLPVSGELLSDFTTPIEMMRILKNVSTHCFLLESASGHEAWGRYTFLGFDPKLEITCLNGALKAGSLRFATEDPAACLRQILAEHKSPRFDYLPPFTGGLVGYFSYDYLGYSEPSVRSQVEDTEAFRDLDLMLFDKVIAFDHLRQKMILMVNMSLDDAETGYNRAVLELRRLAALLRDGEKEGGARGEAAGPGDRPF